MYILKETQATATMTVEMHTPRIAGPWSSLLRDTKEEGASVAIFKELHSIVAARRETLDAKQKMLYLGNTKDQ